MELVRITINKATVLVEEAKFAEARAIICTLPDEPEELPSLKKSVLGQIDEAQKRYTVAEEARASFAQAKALAEAGKFDEARQSVCVIPDELEELPILKKNFMAQIDEAETYSSLIGTMRSSAHRQSWWSRFKKWFE